jgi:hypothetical protein
MQGREALFRSAVNHLSGVFPSGLRDKILYASSLGVCWMSHPSRPPSVAHQNNIFDEHRLRSSSLCIYIHSPVASSLLSNSQYYLYSVILKWMKLCQNYTRWQRWSLHPYYCTWYHHGEYSVCNSHGRSGQRPNTVYPCSNGSVSPEKITTSLKTSGNFCATLYMFVCQHVL